MVSAKLPWSHNLILIEKLKNMESRYWYGAKAIENGWSVTALEHQIATGLINRERKKKLQNFDKLLPAVQSELAIQTMKDPYIFDFVKFDEKMKERQIEDELVKNITNFLLEMGKGFAYMGHQYPLALGNDEFAPLSAPNGPSSFVIMFAHINIVPFSLSFWLKRNNLFLFTSFPN